MMKSMLILPVLVGLLGAPAVAQEEVTCGDYSLMDNAQQMETIAKIESLAAEMDKTYDLTAPAIHEKLAADCKGKVAVLVIERVKGYHPG